MTTAHIFKNRFTDTSFLFQVMLGIASIAALIVSARIQVPMIPVPITLQTAVVLLLPCLLGVRMALTVLGSYFALGAMGLPVFAMTAGALPGLAYFAGPTGGYLAGFVLAVILTGYGFAWIKQHARGFSGLAMSLAMLCALMLAGHAVILSVGMLWLAFGLPQMGLMSAFTAGVVPFLIGTVIKSGIAASLAGWALNK